MADERTTAERYAYAYGVLAEAVKIELDYLRAIVSELHGPISNSAKGVLLEVNRVLIGVLETTEKSLQPQLAQHELDGRHDARA